jgi:hypothetical protein
MPNRSLPTNPLLIGIPMDGRAALKVSGWIETGVLVSRLPIRSFPRLGVTTNRRAATLTKSPSLSQAHWERKLHRRKRVRFTKTRSQKLTNVVTDQLPPLECNSKKTLTIGPLVWWRRKCPY